MTLPLAFAQPVPGDGETARDASITTIPFVPGTDPAPDASAGRGRVVVGHHPGSLLGLPERLAALGGVLVGGDEVLGFVVVEADKPRDLVLRARADPAVRYAELDLPARAAYLPNDPQWSQQYGPQNVGAPAAWDFTRGSATVAVCVVDSGVRYTHEDLDGARYKGGHDFVNNDTDPLDDNGHGTHVAGIALGAINNTKGVAGIANVSHYAVKVLNAAGSGTASGLAQGIRWCADNTMNRTVISVSIAVGGHVPAVHDAVKHALGKGKPVVAATGNDGCGPCVTFPAAYPEAIAVGCTNATRGLCSFSNRGPEVDLVAPGASILSAWHTLNNAYATASGTSMSTPVVSGAAALIWSRYPALGPLDLRIMMEETARDLGVPGHDTSFGMGELNLSRAIVGRVPSAPRDLNVTLVGSRIEVAWTPPLAQGGAITGYRVYRGVNGSAVAFLANVLSNTTGYQDLTCSNSTQCRYVVRALNVHGTGAATPETVPRANAAPILGALRCAPSPVLVNALVTCDMDVRDDSMGVAYNVTWGDGNRTRLPATGHVTPGKLVVNRAYARAGTFTVNVTVEDTGGRALSRNASVQVVTPNDCGTGREAGDTHGSAAPLALPFVGCVGSLVGNDTYDYYAVNLTRGQTLNVSMTPNAASDFDLCVISANMSVAPVCSARFANATETIVRPVNDSGVWNIVVIRWTGEGNYTMSASSVAPPSQANPAPIMRAITCVDNPARVGDTTTCLFRANDDGARVYYVVQWGEGNQTRVPASGTLREGSTASATRTWPAAGAFTVTVRAYDALGQASEPIQTIQFVDA